MVRGWAPILLLKTQRTWSRILLICSESWVESPRIVTRGALMIMECSSQSQSIPPSASRDQAEVNHSPGGFSGMCSALCLVGGSSPSCYLFLKFLTSFLRNSIFPDLLFSFLFLRVLETTLSCAVFLLILGQHTQWLSKQLVPSGSICWEWKQISNPGS